MKKKIRNNKRKTKEIQEKGEKIVVVLFEMLINILAPVIYVFQNRIKFEIR